MYLKVHKRPTVKRGSKVMHTTTSVFYWEILHAMSKCQMTLFWISIQFQK